MPEGWANYIKVKEIGSGSFGKAVLVKCASTGKVYIVKTVDISRMSSKQRRDAINEVKLLAACRHPYIISYKESFLERGQLCIVMDYAEGGDFSKLLAKRRKARKYFTEDEVMRWLTQLVLAIRYMHDKHVIHRDLKPQNFFLSANGRVKVGDFGIAKVLENTAVFAQTQIGTPYYLSPEICTGTPYTFASDVWSLGCVLYEMTNLRVPFEANNIQVLVQKITSGKISGVFNPMYSREVRELCEQMLSVDWQLRPTAEQLCRHRSVQQMIQKMLEEEKAAKGKSPGTPLTGRQPSTPGDALGPNKTTPPKRSPPLRSLASGVRKERSAEGQYDGGEHGTGTRGQKIEARRNTHTPQHTPVVTRCLSGEGGKDKRTRIPPPLSPSIDIVSPSGLHYNNNNNNNKNNNIVISTPKAVGNSVITTPKSAPVRTFHSSPPKTEESVRPVARRSPLSKAVRSRLVGGGGLVTRERKER